MPRFFFGRPGLRPVRTSVLASTALLMLVTLAFVACGGSSAAVQPTATVPKPTPTPTILFQADWTHGLDGWHATPGWHVVNGGLQNDLGAERSLTIPYQPPAGAYAIELDLQIVSIPSKDGYYIFDVPAGVNGDGYQAGVQGLRVPGDTRPNGDHAAIRTLISPLNDQDTSLAIRAQTDYEPGDQVRTYRVVVDGKSLDMYVDGRFYVATATTRGPSLATGPLVLRVSGALFRITGLRVLAA